MGSWQAISFSEAQQTQFFIDADGKPTDEEKHKLALEANMTPKA